MFCLKNVICSLTMSITFHVLRVPRADPRFEENHISNLIIRWAASVDRSDWSIACSTEKSMRGRFLQCFLREPFLSSYANSPSDVFRGRTCILYSWLYHG